VLCVLVSLCKKTSTTALFSFFKQLFRQAQHNTFTTGNYLAFNPDLGLKALHACRLPAGKTGIWHFLIKYIIDVTPSSAQLYVRDTINVFMDDTVALYSRNYEGDIQWQFSTTQPGFMNIRLWL